MSQSSENTNEFTSTPFRYYIRRHKRIFTCGLIALFVTNSLDALPPLLIGMAIDQIAAQKPMTTVGETVLGILGVALALSLARYLWRIFWGRFHHSVAADLRNKIFDKFTALGPSFYQKRPVGQLMSLITNDVNSFRMAMGPGILILMDAIFILFIVPPLMVSISPAWTWKTLVLMPLIPFIVAKVLRLIHKRYRDQQDKFADMSGSAQEIISGVRVIKGYGQEKNQTKIFNNYSRNFQIACDQVAQVDSSFSPVLELGVTVGSVILLFIGAPEVIAGAVSVGSFFAFYQYIQRMIWPMTAIGMGISFIQQGKASFRRIAELLEAPVDIADTGTQEIKAFDKLEVKNLTFTYPGTSEPALQNISFSLNAGETLGIVGTTGSGKSTLVELLCRLYPVAEDSIFINGRPLQDIQLASLRQLIAMVPQDTFLFSKRVADNIALGRDSWSLDEVRSAARLVNLEKEIEDMPDAYNAYLGERGVNLSGGQKQRMTIARALIRDAPITIFDDSLSSVDTKTEKNIIQPVKKRAQKKDQPGATILISHRLETLKWADKILVLNGGQMEALGTADEVFKHSPTYRQLVDMQKTGVSRDVDAVT